MSIRTARKAMGITLSELSGITGIPRMSILRYEKGQRQPVLENAIKLAEALGIPIESMVRSSRDAKDSA